MAQLELLERKLKEEQEEPTGFSGFFGSPMIDFAFATYPLEEAFEELTRSGLEPDKPFGGEVVNEDVPYPPVDWDAVVHGKFNYNGDITRAITRLRLIAATI